MTQEVEVIFSPDNRHEQVVFCHDETTGLRAIIAIYSTALGPSLGGTRFYPYESEDAAIADVQNLSKGMAYKNALAGLALGGGKAVIIGDPDRDKSPALLEAYGRYIDSLGGRYITAADVGTYVADMDVIAGQTAHVVGRSPEKGGVGDPSPWTALGVFHGMRACAEHRWGTPSLEGKRVGVAGVGKVGHTLVEHVLDAGADVVITDVRRDAVDRVVAAHPQVSTVDSAADMVAADIDVYAPCAMGGALDDDNVAHLRASIVCGAANNQLAHVGIDKDLQTRGILYAPDYVVNAGGVIHVAHELPGYDKDEVAGIVAGIYDTTKQILELADAEGVPPATAADRLAEQRMAAG